jgi:hypothetical protein
MRVARTQRFVYIVTFEGIEAPRRFALAFRPPAGSVR